MPPGDGLVLTVTLPAQIGLQGQDLVIVAAPVRRAFMKLLLDTNIVIPLEPTKSADVEANSAGALELARYASMGGHQLFIHPQIRADLARDKDEERRGTRLLQITRYLDLPDPPLSRGIEGLLEVVNPSAHDQVDNALVAAVHADAVDYLVTEDEGMHRKARRLGIQDRVLTLVAARDVLRDLFDKTPRPPPFVAAVKAHGLDAGDSIFASFREDYPDFDDWFGRARRLHRDAWIIRSVDDAYDGVAIVKPEDDATMGRTLKICSFKVADRANGWKFGELLLKAIFDFCVVNKFAAVYVTVFERHARLIQLFGLFGFLAQEGRTGRGELVLAKRLIPPADRATFAPLDFHTRFGPPEVRAVANDPGYVIPIKPVYHDALFPDAIPEQRQQSLALEPSKPFGNAIRKAYLCHAIIRKIAPGDNAFFYRSFDARAIACTGVIESTLVSQSVEEIARLVGTRTVYRFEEIQEMCAEGKVLVLMFRHARTLRGAISFEELAQNGVLKGPPQSIVQVHDDSARAWLANRITEQP